MHSFAKDPLFAYDDAMAATKALSELVTILIEHGEDYSEIANGVTIMFQQQMATFDMARDLVAQALKPKDEAGVSGLRQIVPAGINMVMVIEPDGRRYMTTPALAGVDAAGTAKPRFEDETPMDTRKRVIAELVGDGKAAGDIAQAMGLKKDTVERVIGQLLARQPEEPAKQAVNQ